MRDARVLVGIAVALVGSGVAHSAREREQASPPRHVVLEGYPVTAPDGVTPVEGLVLVPELADVLLAVPLEGSVSILDWPVAPGRRREVRLARRDVYAPDARVIVVDDGMEVEAPRSALRFFFDEAEGGEPGRLVVAVDPEAARVQAHYLASSGWFELGTADGGGYVLAPSQAFAEPGTGPLEFDCGEETLPRTEPGAFDWPRGTAEPAARGMLRTATLAVDTDNELMQLKFADSTTNATNYIASLFAVMTTIYERDLSVRLLQGTTFLRVSSTPDPYEQSGTGSASSAKLNEFRTYWDSNYDHIPRALAMMLSGKQGSPNSASGIAYVDTLCEQDSGYGFNQVFKFAMNTASSDVRIVGHEVGHNFGSRHTHCYLDPTPIDTCYSQESGCYTGPTSCPAPTTINGVTNVTGTLMSYCHQLGGCSAATVFHPRTVGIISPRIDAHEGECIFALSNPKEASPEGDLHVERLGSSTVEVSYTPACGATDHTLYAGNLATLQASGISWTQRHCFLGSSGTTVVDPGAGSVYLVVVANNGSTEGSYGPGTAGERPAAGAGTGCQYTQDLSGSCP